MITMTVYAYTNRSSLFEEGRQADMSDEAAHSFSHYEEVELKIEVDENTGMVVKQTAVEL